MSQSKTNFTKLTFREFEIFLLIYASHIDYEFSDKEKKFIMERAESYTFQNMLDLFLNNGDYACMEIILQHKEAYFSTEKEQNALFHLLIELFKVDGNYSRIEKSFITFFEKMIDN